MKKTIIASKNLEELGLRQVIVTLNTSELTICIKYYYDGKICKKETNYIDNEDILDISWNNEIKYYQKNEYKIIII